MKQTIKRIQGIVLALVFLVQIFGIQSVSAETSLTDVTDHWAKDQIETLVDSGAITGYPDNTFLPDQSISRAEFITVIVKSLDLEPKVQIDFSDTINHWASDYIGAAINYGLIDSEDYLTSSMEYKFSPDQGITRLEMAEIIVRALGKDYEARTYAGNLEAYSDSGLIERDLLGYVNSASTMGIINGYPDGTFGADLTATRAEACVMLTRMFEELEAKVDEPIVDSEDIYASYQKSLVKIYNYDTDNALLGTGSGFVMDMDGKIVTNYHVIDGASRLEVEFEDDTVMEVVAINNYDISKDVAVINVGTISNDATPVVFGNDRILRTGSTIYTIGYPLGEDLSITNGLISSKYKEVYDEYYVQISAPISPGNSGGPLVNKYGEVIGINTLGSTSYVQNMNYSAPISFIAEVLTEENTLSMGEFASRDTDVVSAHNIGAMITSVYGISKATGEKVYQEDNHFDLDEITTYGVTVNLFHEFVGGDNALALGLDMYDGDYDWYDYDYAYVSLSDTNTTSVDFVFSDAGGYGLGNGKYFIEIYVSDNLYLTEEISFTDHSGFGDYNLKKSEVTVYDPRKSSDTDLFVEEDTFNEASLASIGISHEMIFEETFDYYYPFLVRYELRHPDGYVDTIYDTVFGVPYENSGSNTFNYGYDFVGYYTPGDYVLKTYVEDDLINVSSFVVEEDHTPPPSAEVWSITYYDTNGTEQEVFDFYDNYGLGITLAFETIEKDTLVEVGYGIRAENEGQEEVMDDRVLDYVYATSNNSNDHVELLFGNLYLPDRFYEDLPVNQKLYLDIYYDGDVIETYTLYEAFDYASTLSVESLAIIATNFSHDGWVTASLADKIAEVERLMTVVSEDLSIEDLESGYIGYMLTLNEPHDGQDLTAAKGLSIELIRQDTERVVARQEEVDVLWLESTGGFYLDSLEVVEGESFATGTYDLQVNYGDEGMIIFEKEITIID